MDRTGRKAGGLQDKFKKLGKSAGLVLAGLAAGGAVAGVKFFNEATEGASDLEEALSKSNTVFGEQAKAIESFAGAAAENFGLSKRAALDAAGGFGNMFDQLDIGEGQASAMSQGIIGLAADFASFNNLETEDVIAAQSAAFRGEFDSLQRVLPLINAATVQTKAMEQTGKKNAKELTQQEKAMATYALMVEGAGEAQGDFAKTSDGLANSQRIAAAEMENMRNEIGTKMLPVAKKITQVKLELARVFANRVVPAIERVIAVLRPLIEDGWEKLQEVISDPEFQKAMEEIGATIEETMTLIADVVEETTILIQNIWDRWGDEIQGITSGKWEQVSSIIIGTLTAIKGVLQVITGIMEGDWDKFNEGLKTIASGAWTAIRGFVVGGVMGWKTLVDAGSAKLEEAMRALPGKIGAAVSGMWDSLWEGFRTVINKIIGAWNNLEFNIPGTNIGFGTPDLAPVRGGRSSGGRSFSSSTGPRSTASRMMAAGGIGNGLQLVGEHGTELVNLGAGGRVMSAPDTERALARNGQGQGMTVNLYVSGSVLTERDLVAVIRDELVNGGLSDALAGV